MFVVWKNIDKQGKTEQVEYVRRKQTIRIDCSKSSTGTVQDIDRAYLIIGLFFGLVYLTATLTAMAIFYGYSMKGDNTTAAFVYGMADIIQFLIGTVGCLIALYQMRMMNYLEKQNHELASNAVVSNNFPFSHRTPSCSWTRS
jgi:hypothetical protein